MSTNDFILLIIFIVCFVGFGLALAWGDFRTVEIARRTRERALSGATDQAGHGAHH